MKQIQIPGLTLALAATVIMAGSWSASAQTLALQLRASNYNPVTGVWTDSSGNNDNATYLGSSTPLLTAGLTPNGSSAVALTGVGSLTLSSALSAGSGYTVFAFCQVASDSASRNALTGGSSPGALEYDVYSGNQDYLREYQADVAHGSAVLPTTSFSLIDLAVNASGSSFRLNGSSDGTGGGASFGSSITRIGNNEGGGDGFVGDVAEIDIYSGVLTAPQISTVESMLTAEYVTVVPEPSTWLMMTGGLGCLLAIRRLTQKHG